MVDLVAALELNLWEMHRDFRRVPGAEVHDLPDLLWYTLPSPHSWLNGASRTFLGDDAASRIRGVRGAISARGRNVMWHVTPSCRPRHLAAELEAAGFEGAGSPGMALDLGNRRTIEEPDDFLVRMVANRDGVFVWTQTFDRAFAIDPPRAENHPWLEPFARLTLDRVSPCRLFIGYFFGDPVATALAFLAGPTVGVYGVGTLPTCRGRGLGTAITSAAIEWGARQGAQTAVLSASELGEPVYRRMGFKTICDTSQWVVVSPANEA